MSKIIESYTRESGVRNLEREIGSVCRAKAVEYAEAKDAGNTGKASTSYRLWMEDTDYAPDKYKPQLTVEDIEEILGIEKFDEEIAEKTRFVIHSSVVFQIAHHDTQLSTFTDCMKPTWHCYWSCSLFIWRERFYPVY